MFSGGVGVCVGGGSEREMGVSGEGAGEVGAGGVGERREKGALSG